MRGQDRKALRTTVAQAIEAADEDLTRISAWTQTVGQDRLPAFAVATPTVRHDRADMTGLDQDSLTLIVMLKRTGDGDEIEDILDDDSDTLAPVVLAAVQAASVDCELSETAIRVDRTGDTPVGTLTLTFTVTSWADPA